MAFSPAEEGNTIQILPTASDLASPQSLYNITEDSPFFTLKELYDLVGHQCPAAKHCALWPRSFLKGGMWTGIGEFGSSEEPSNLSQEKMKIPVFHPYNCWWFQFSGKEPWLSQLSESNVGIFLDGFGIGSNPNDNPMSSVFAKVVELEPRFRYIPASLAPSKEEFDGIVAKIQGEFENAHMVHLSVFTNFRASDAAKLYELLKLLKARLLFASTRVFWVNQPFASRETVDAILPLNHKMSAMFNKNKMEGLTHVDVFGPTLFGPDDAVDQVLPDYVRIVALNFIFQNTVLQGSALPKSQHICKTESCCSSCVMVPSRLPSSRLTFKLLSSYFTRHATPTVISISPSKRIWAGTWKDFADENGNSPLSVRMNYKTVKSRQFRRLHIRRYLRIVGILQDKKPGAVSPSLNSTLPLYAGNNKLSAETMRSFKFRYPPWFTTKSLQAPSMWLGPKDSISSLHVDHSNQGNLAYQVLGSKLWHLFSPEAQPYSYLIKIGPVRWSRISDPREYRTKQWQRHPKFKFAIANSMMVHVKEGEMLYNPDEWGHAVYNTNASLMLNFWLKNGRLRQSTHRGNGKS